MTIYGVIRVARVWVLAALVCLFLNCLGLYFPTTYAAGPRVLPVGQLPADIRLGSLKDLDGYFPFVVPASIEAWQQRSDTLRRQLLVSQGLWPMPTRQPLQSVVHGRIQRDTYTVEKVYFQSMPGFFVTGNLYRPVGTSGRLPAVLCPHGHWKAGRFYDCGRDEVRKLIVQGAERFEDGGRSPLQSRCVQLARMGCVVFHYDMIGYADSQQISPEIIHGFSEQRPEMNRPQGWGLFSPPAESRLQSAMGLQTFNSLCALDFLASLPDVDPARLAVTGASGGGTQTFLLSAIDPRIQVAFPAVMVSTAMQGGCTCENACCLRVDTGNIEIAALFAPKPMGLTAANDWTVEMRTKGFPDLQRIYRLLGAPENVMLTALTHFDHNYNYVSRAAMYSWLNKHLHLGFSNPIVEEDYPRLTQEQMTVWDDEHPRPPSGNEFERQLLAWWHADCERQLAALLPTDDATLQQYRTVIGGGVDAIIARQLPERASLQLTKVSEDQRDGYVEILGLLTHRLPPRQSVGASSAGKTEGIQEQLPLVLLTPGTWSRRVCVMALPSGKAGLFEETGVPMEPVRRLLQAGVAVCAADLLYQGEFLKEGQTMEKTRRVENPREAAAYTFGYNPTLFAQRVRDLLSVIALFGEGDFATDRIDLVGIGKAGPWAAVARAQAAPHIASLAVDQANFRFATVDEIHDPMFLPGAARYHDLPGILALGAPGPLWLAECGPDLPAPISAAYEAAGSPSAVTCFRGAAADKLRSAVEWLLK